MEKPVSRKKIQSIRGKEGITQITVSGFKSINREQSIEIKPLTILAGANSSGKSSIMQPLLLLKQTLEASYDPGALLLNGPNAKFTSSDQLLTRIGKSARKKEFSISISRDDDMTFKLFFRKGIEERFDVVQMDFVNKGVRKTLRYGMTDEEIKSHLPFLIDFIKLIEATFKEPSLKFAVVRDRCFLEIDLRSEGKPQLFHVEVPLFGPSLRCSIQEMIHLPGLRGNPERAYPVTAVESTFPGTFEKYAASVIAHWQSSKDEEKIQTLSEGLEKLGLTWKIIARSINYVQVELQVGRLARPSKAIKDDLVSIADAGFGVSQTLPVLVALLAAEPGQMVYLEQPEIHLHPRAQTAMAQLLADAANRGVRVVAETHSSLLLLGIQTLVAEGKLSPDNIKLHWFKRGADGSTEIVSADIDNAGSFGDWPEDFADVNLESEARFLDAAEKSRRKRKHG